METIPGHPDLLLLPRRSRPISDERRRLHRLYRHAVVLRSDLFDSSLAQASGENHDEKVRFEQLRAALAQHDIAIGSGRTPFPPQDLSLVDSEMVLELNHAIAELEQRICPGAESSRAALVAAFSG